jgi:sulfoxide reductase heme-binding subunit YedZ
MSEIRSSSLKPVSRWAWLTGGALLAGILFVFSLLAQTPLGTSLGGFLTRLFAADSSQVTWYITRAAGLTGYLLLWLSMVWGLAVSSKIVDKLLHRAFTFDFHQFISLLAIGFIVLHMGALLFDQYLPYSLPQLLVPFLSSYRPVWVGLGVVAFYLIALVTVTFYLRSRIGMKAFRAIHVFSLVAYLGVTLHAFFSGTDSSLPAVMTLYMGSFLGVVFLTAYWALTRGNQRHPVRPPARVTGARSAAR